MRHFFWPGIFTDISEYCRSCPECQKGMQKGIFGTTIWLIASPKFVLNSLYKILVLKTKQDEKSPLGSFITKDLTLSKLESLFCVSISECPCSAVQTRKQRAKELIEVEKEQASGKVYTNDTPISETVEIRNPENAFSFCSRQELIETQKLIR
jgi:hypothetical protein